MFSQRVTPRFGDMDGLRHINNTVLPQWFELARTPVFKLFVDDVTDYDSWNMILARLELDFVSQMRFGSDVEIKTWVDKIGNSSFVIAHEAWQNGKLGAKCKAVCVHFDFKIQKSAPIPDDIRKKLEEHTSSCND